MTMLCRITDEQVNNRWEDDYPCQEPIMKSLEDITLYDLMGEDNYVWVGKNKGSGYIMEIENDDHHEPYFREIGINECAMESLALFCRQFLKNYEKIKGE